MSLGLTEPKMRFTPEQAKGREVAWDKSAFLYHLPLAHPLTRRGQPRRLDRQAGAGFVGI